MIAGLQKMDIDKLLGMDGSNATLSANVASVGGSNRGEKKQNCIPDYLPWWFSLKHRPEKFKSHVDNLQLPDYTHLVAKLFSSNFQVLLEKQKYG